MEPVEDQERERDPGDDAPGQEAEELCLDALRDVPVGHEGVQHPERDVGEEHEGDDLPAGLGLLLGPGGADPPAGLADDHALEGDLDQEEGALDEDQHAREVKRSERVDVRHRGEDPEDGVDVGPEDSDAGEQIVQLVGLVV